MLIGSMKHSAASRGLEDAQYRLSSMIILPAASIQVKREGKLVNVNTNGVNIPRVRIDTSQIGKKGENSYFAALKHIVEIE